MGRGRGLVEISVRLLLFLWGLLEIQQWHSISELWGDKLQSSQMAFLARRKSCMSLSVKGLAPYAGACVLQTWFPWVSKATYYQDSDRHLTSAWVGNSQESLLRREPEFPWSEASVSPEPHLGFIGILFWVCRLILVCNTSYMVTNRKHKGLLVQREASRKHITGGECIWLYWFWNAVLSPVSVCAWGRSSRGSLVKSLTLQGAHWLALSIKILFRETH